MIMKKILQRLNTSKHVKKTTAFLKENKKIIIIALILIIGIDIFFVSQSSDFVTFGILLVYIVVSSMFVLKSKTTFLFCLGLLFAMFFNYLFTSTSVATEKAAVWLVLFLAVGIFQQWRE